MTTERLYSALQALGGPENRASLPETEWAAASHTSAAVVAYLNAGGSYEDAAAAIPRIHAAYMAILTSGSAPVAKQEPAVPVKKSVTYHHLISLEDGKKYKTLKRHLRGLGMTPDDYRAKWGLRADYPMTAPEYSLKRSQLAKDSGLGKK